MNKILFTATVGIISLSQLLAQEEQIIEGTITDENHSGQNYRVARRLTLKAPFHHNAVTDSDWKAYIDVGNPSPDHNYVRTETIRKAGVTTENAIKKLNQNEKQTTFQYYDGLGRPTQTVASRQSPMGFDQVSYQTYDDFGRPEKAYLPYVETGATGQYYDQPDNSDFYNNHFNNNSGNYAFTETVYEDSPLNRVIATHAPGQPWSKTRGNRPVNTDYDINDATDQVTLWKIEDHVLMAYEFYSPGTLYKTVTSDENEATDQGETIEFTNKQGQTILKRVKHTNTGYTNTYYVYDDFGNLRYVLPPKACASFNNTDLEEPTGYTLHSTDINETDLIGTKNAYIPTARVRLKAPLNLTANNEIIRHGIVPNQNHLDTWAFQYKYDYRRRMIEKKVPGAGWVHLVYDQRNRLIMTQDGNQRTNDQWAFTKYDAFNRPVLTGILTEDRDRATLQIEGNQITDYVTEYTGTGALLGYNKSGYPNTAEKDDLLTITYYDNYDFTQDNHWKLGNHTTAPKAKTHVTGTKTRVLTNTTSDWIESLTLYDNRYRVNQTITMDHQGNKDTHTNQYYSDIHPLITQSTHTHQSQLTAATITIQQTYDYDHADRLMSITHQINNEEEIVILENQYNELGELITKKLHQEDQDQYSQEINYQYNIRGWLTQINDPSISDPENYYAMELQYNGATNAQYNGNIGGVKWKNPFEAEQRNYDYVYDRMSRIKSATYSQSGASTMNYDVSEITYDVNGNIKTLKRQGDDKDQPDQTIDELDYDYIGNQLLSVKDKSKSDTGFKDGINLFEEYRYDANGNMVTDLNKGIENIEYNHLNLPVKIDMGSGDSLVYVYDASGTKHAQIVYESGTQTKKTDYRGDFVYENDTLQFIKHDEGRVVYDIVNDAYDYQYHLKDHLGNVRATFKTESDVEAVQATFEPDQTATETEYFTGYAGMTTITADLFNHTTGGNTSIRLNGSANETEGMGKSLMVKPGDVIEIEVYAKYYDATESAGWTNLLNTLAAQLAANTAGIVIDGGGIGADAFPFADWTGKANPTSAPKAYLNYMVFDQNYQLIGELTGYQQISTAAKENGSDVAHEELSHSITITEAGYVYVYLSNEEGSPIDVFFDDFEVTQNHTKIVSKDDYYPFGLTFNSYQRAASTDQNIKYNGMEEVKDLGLDWHFPQEFRTYDAALGRFFQIDPVIKMHESPYAWNTNNPILYADPLGSDSTQRADALAKAQEFVDQNSGNTWESGAKGKPGENVDCSGLTSACAVAGDESNPIAEGGENDGGVKRTADNLDPVDEADVIAGNFVILDNSKSGNDNPTGHIGIIKSVVRDDDGNITNMTMIDSGGKPSSGTSGPRNSSLITNGSKDYWGKRITGFRKFDTRPDVYNGNPLKPVKVTSSPLGNGGRIKPKTAGF